MDDMNLLLVGGDGAINAVVILKWELHRTTNLVSGFGELYVHDRNGMPVLHQREVCSRPLVYSIDAPTVFRIFSQYLRISQLPNDWSLLTKKCLVAIYTRTQLGTDLPSR